MRGRSILPLMLLMAADASPPRLALPLACTIGRDCWVQNWPDHDAGPGVADGCGGQRSYDGHDGTDIRIRSLAAQSAGVTVTAAAAGTVLRVRDGEPDRLLAEGEVAAPGRECGNGLVIDHGGGWQTQYCHMAQGSLAVRPRQSVATGAVLGRVGLSGNTAFPHLHLTLRHNGAAVDPLAPAGRCAPGASLWAPAAAVTYADVQLIAAGFAPRPVTLAEVMAGEASPRPDTAAPAVVAWVLAIGLAAGDTQHLALLGPDGAELARNDAPPLVRARAQQLLFAGRRRPEGGWPPGISGRYWVERRGRTVFDRRLPL